MKPYPLFRRLTCFGFSIVIILGIVSIAFLVIPPQVLAQAAPSTWKMTWKATSSVQGECDASKDDVFLSRDKISNGTWQGEVLLDNDGYIISGHQSLNLYRYSHRYNTNPYCGPWNYEHEATYQTIDDSIGVEGFGIPEMTNRFDLNQIERDGKTYIQDPFRTGWNRFIIANIHKEYTYHTWGMAEQWVPSEEWWECLPWDNIGAHDDYESTEILNLSGSPRIMGDDYDDLIYYTVFRDDNMWHHFFTWPGDIEKVDDNRYEKHVSFDYGGLEFGEAEGSYDPFYGKCDPVVYDMDWYNNWRLYYQYPTPEDIEATWDVPRAYPIHYTWDFVIEKVCNNPPEFTAPTETSYELKVGEELKIDIEAIDPEEGNIEIVRGGSEVWPESAYLVEGSGTSSATATFHFTPTEEDVKNSPFKFVIKAKNECSETLLWIKVEGCTLDIDRQYQNVGYYAGNCYDHDPDPDGDGKCPINNIGKWGCSVTSIAMALSKYDGYHTDPGTLHDFMMDPYHNCFNNDGSFDPISTVRLFTNNALGYYTLYINSQDTPNSADEALEVIVCENKWPAIVGVNIGAREPGKAGHYVVVVGREEGWWKINDPEYPGSEFLDSYGDYIVVGYIAPFVHTYAMRGQVQILNSEVDLSELIIMAEDTVELNVIDQNGNHTGYDLQSLKIVKDIPDSEYSYLSLQNIETQEWWPVGLKIVDILKPSIGKYIIMLKGLEMGHYNLYISSFKQDGSRAQPIALMGVTNVGSASTFDLQFDPKPNMPVSVSRVATFESTLQDIGNCRKLGMIDNDGIANALRNYILDAAKKAEGGKTKPCINILNEFKDLVETQTLKHINEMATLILMEDVDYLLLQLQ